MPIPLIQHKQFNEALPSSSMENILGHGLHFQDDHHFIEKDRKLARIFFKVILIGVVEGTT